MNVNSSSKYISVLDLQFLDLKFKSLKEKNPIYSLSHKRSSLLPSLSSTEIQADLNDVQASLVDLSSIPKKSHSHMSALDEKLAHRVSHEIAAYQLKIKNIKKQNELIHKQISKLYHHQDRRDPYSSDSPREDRNHGKGNKHVRNVRLFLRESEEPEKKNSSLQTLTKNKQNKLNTNNGEKYEKFYENLYREKEDSEQEEQLDLLRKRMANNNFDKNVESFLVEKKMRIPEFIKKLR